MRITSCDSIFGHTPPQLYGEKGERLPAAMPRWQKLVIEKDNIWDVTRNNLQILRCYLR